MTLDWLRVELRNRCCSQCGSMLRLDARSERYVIQCTADPAHTFHSPRECMTWREWMVLRQEALRTLTAHYGVETRG